MNPAAVPLPVRPADISRATDRALMTRIAEGDAGAFEEIYRRHRRQALAHARSLCSSRELAEDVTQEAFVALWRGAHGYRPALGTVPGWLSRVVRNRAIDAWRRAAARPVEVALPEGGPDQLAGAAEAPAAAVFLAYYADMTHPEIAAHAGAPIGTVKGRIRLGLEKLRDGCEDAPARPRMAVGCRAA